MKIETDSSENTVTVILDDGFTIYLTYDEFKELKKLINEVEDEEV